MAAVGNLILLRKGSAPAIYIQLRTHTYETYFSLPLSFTSGIASLSHLRVPLTICAASPVGRVPSSNGIRPRSAEGQDFSPYIGVQPSGTPALEGVYLS